MPTQRAAREGVLDFAFLPKIPLFPKLSPSFYPASVPCLRPTWWGETAFMESQMEPTFLAGVNWNFRLERKIEKSSLLHGALSSPPSTGTLPKDTHTPARKGLGPCLSMPYTLHSLSGYLPQNGSVRSLPIS